MSIVSVGELVARRTSGRAEDGVRTYGRVFLVVVDSKFDGANLVLGAAGLPQKLDSYSTLNETDERAVVIQRRARQMRDTSLHWEVAVNYSSDVDIEKEEQEDNPLSEPAVVTFGFEVFRTVARIAEDEENDVAILNSANQPFTPPPMKDDSRPFLSVARNQFTFDPLQAIDFKDAINNDTFAGADIGQVKVKGITATKEIQPGNPEVKFWRVTYVFIYQREGWKLKILDTGTRVRDNGDFVPYVENGVVTEVRLDGLGNKLDDDAADVFLEFDIYKSRRFADLNIDQTLGLEPPRP